MVHTGTVVKWTHFDKLITDYWWVEGFFPFWQRSIISGEKDCWILYYLQNRTNTSVLIKNCADSSKKDSEKWKHRQCFRLEEVGCLICSDCFGYGCLLSKNFQIPQRGQKIEKNNQFFNNKKSSKIGFSRFIYKWL